MVQVPENEKRKKDKHQLVITFLDFLNSLAESNRLKGVCMHINWLGDFRDQIVEQEQCPDTPIDDGCKFFSKLSESPPDKAAKRDQHSKSKPKYSKYVIRLEPLVIFKYCQIMNI